MVASLQAHVAGPCPTSSQGVARPSKAGKRVRGRAIGCPSSTHIYRQYILFRYSQIIRISGFKRHKEKREDFGLRRPSARASYRTSHAHDRDSASRSLSVMNRVSKSILQDLRCTAKRHYSKSRRPPSKPSFAASAISATLGVGTGTGIIYFLWPEALQSTPTSARAPLSPSRFTASTVVSNVDCGPQTKLLQVVVPPHLIPDVKSKSSFSPIWSVFIKDDDIQVERPYTPLEGIDKDGKMLFWIKKYPKGEVGRWLHSKTSNDKIELRGPLTTWAWKDDVWDEVIMVCQLMRPGPLCPHSSARYPEGPVSLRSVSSSTQSYHANSRLKPALLSSIPP